MIADLVAVLLPETILVAFGCVALLATRARVAVAASGVGLALASVATVTTWAGISDAGSRTGFDATVVVDADALAVVALVLIATAVALALSARTMEARPELCALLLFAAAGLGLAASAADLVALVAGVELGSVALSAALATAACDARSREAATKHALAGLLAFVLGITGASIIAALTGATRLVDVAEAMPVLLAGRAGGYAVAGAAFLAAGLLVRVAAAPFHLWLLDAVEGAPRATSGTLAVAAPLAALAGLGRVLSIGVPGLSAALVAAGVLSALWGSLAAATGRSAARLLANLAVANAGWLLVAAGSGTKLAPVAAGFALPALGALAALATLGAERVDDFFGLARRSPLAAIATAVVALGVAGSPPAGGLVARAAILAGLARSGSVAALVALAVAAVAATVACARLVGPMYAGRATGDEPARR